MRTWTVRGTVHLIAASDRPWLHALLAERNARVFGARFERFGIVEEVRAMRRDVVELCAERPRDRAFAAARADRARASVARARPDQHVRSVALIAGTGGHRHGGSAARGRAAAGRRPRRGARDPRRSLPRAGYGPCDAADIAKWSSLPITQARRALDAAGPQSDNDAWPLDDPPPCLLLAAFDTLMLGYRTREPFVAAKHDHHVLKGGGMLKPVVLNRGLATGTWSIRNGCPQPSWFGQPRSGAAFAREATDIERFLAS